MLEIESISKTFNPGTVNAKTALKDLSLSVGDGEFITIIGSNGAGKSTLFNAISGEFITDSGRILLDGEDITLYPNYKRAKYIGHLFQDPLSGTAPHMTILENLALAAGHGGWMSILNKNDREFFRTKLKELNMGLEDRLEQPVGLLSGGQRQALTLLMATIVPPKLLLLDEHTAALDPKAAEQIIALTKKTTSENHITCLMITHNIQQALTSGTRTIMMQSGHIVLDLKGKEREGLSVADLLQMFREKANQDLDNDRILLSEE